MKSRLALAALAVLLAGCGTLPNGRRWGQDATIAPGWDRLCASAAHAATSPGTWLPAVSAAGFQIGHLDRDLSEWASSHNPIFGSRENAGNATSTIGAMADTELYLSILLAPDGDTPTEWMISKGKGLAVDLAAVGLNEEATGFFKRTVKRTRPDGSNNLSFPSSHASGTATSSTLAYENIKGLAISDDSKTIVGVSSTALCALGAWGRVEAGVHYPSDALAGLALGHFLALFIHDAFLGLEDERFVVESDPINGDLLVGVNLSW